MINDSSEIGAIYKAATPTPRVGLEQFRSRINSCLKRSDCADEFRVHDALYLSTVEYKTKYSPRRTHVEIQGARIDLGEFFSEIPSPVVNYSTFWQRVRRLKRDELLDRSSLDQAAELNEAEWISYFGGGRRRGFRYEGVEFPNLHGQKFRSIASFLRLIARYDDKAIIWSRIKRGWEIDEALTEPVLSLDERPGTIYLISSDQCSEQYVGLTRTRIEQRWRTHLRAALEIRIDTPLARAIRRIGPDNFTINTLEEDLEQTQLAERERYWIIRLNTRKPNGFNIKPGGEMGGGRGKEIEYEGESFPSIEVASEVLSHRTGIAKHVVHRRLSNGKPIPEQARQMSDHHEAGTNLWRRWKSLINGIKAARRSGEICARWSDYDNFSADVRDGYDPNLSLVRIDESKPWCGENVRWISKQEAIERVHGTELVVEGKTYPSLNAVAREYGIGRTTLKNRLEVQGLALDEAVRKELAPTSKSLRKAPVVVDGNEFPSINQAAKFAAKRYRLSFGQARDRVRRGVPLHGKGKNDA
jgi:group I intron endonuclease